MNPWAVRGAGAAVEHPERGLWDLAKEIPSGSFFRLNRTKSLSGFAGSGFNSCPQPIRWLGPYEGGGPFGSMDRVKDERKRITVLYAGNVQNVGFRFTTQGVAAGFDVCGTVRNLADGRVELVAEGATSELEAFRQAIRDSGLGPLIREEQVHWASPRGDLRGFQILR